MDALGEAFRGLVKRSAQVMPLSGRVLDEAGHGVVGARVQVVLVRRQGEDQPAEAHLIGPWQAASAADGKYVFAGIATPKDVERYVVRVQISAKGYVKTQKEFALRQLLTPRLVRVPDVRLTRADGQ